MKKLLKKNYFLRSKSKLSSFKEQLELEFDILKRNGIKELDKEQKTQTNLEKLLIDEKVDDSFKDPKYFIETITEVALQGPRILSTQSEQRPVTVTVTGAAGQIGYALLPRICAGDMLGKEQKIILKLVDLPSAIKSLEGVKMELEDCAFPLVTKIIVTDDLKEGFTDSDYCLLVGSKPRGKTPDGKIQERSDVLKENAKIFADQGKAINQYAKRSVLCLVVGNPANTNALILSQNAPDIVNTQITAMTRLDHDRGLYQLSKKLNCNVSDIDRFCIWGNHSATQYPDVSNTTIKGVWLRNILKDEDWIFNKFIPTVQKRGAEIIAARGKSSAASAASSIVNHMRDWKFGTKVWTSMAVKSIGQYGVPSTIWSSFPVVCREGDYEVINGIEFDKKSAEYLNQSIKELLDERATIEHLFPKSFYKGLELKKDYFSWKYVNESLSYSFLPLIFDEKLLEKIQSKLTPLIPKGYCFWRTINQEWIRNAFQSLDLSDIEELKQYSKEDISNVLSMVEKLTLSQMNSMETKFKKLNYDQEEYTTIFRKKFSLTPDGVEEWMQKHSRLELSKNGINSYALFVENVKEYLLSSEYTSKNVDCPIKELDKEPLKQEAKKLIEMMNKLN